MIKYITFCFLLFINIPEQNKHEYYVGLTEITFQPEKQRLEIISRLFFDDFEKVLKTRYDNSLELSPSRQSDKIDEYIGRYFNKKLSLSSGDKDLEIKYLGFKFDEDRINIYLKVEDVGELQDLRIQNLLLTDVFEDQKNIVHFFKPNAKKSVLLTRFDSEAMLKFSD